MKKRKRRWGLKTKIMGLIFLLIALLSIWTIWQVSEVLHHYLEIQMEKQGVAIARDIAARSQNLTFADNKYILYREIQVTKATNKDVFYIVIFDGQGKSIINTFSKGVPKGLKEINNIVPTKGYNILSIITEAGVIKDVVVPIGDGKPGYVRVGIRENSIDSAISETVRKIFFQALAVLILGMVAAYCITRVITKPLLELVIATQSIAKGHFTTRVNSESGTEEVDRLAKSFNTMAMKLSSAKENTKLMEGKRKQLLGSVINIQEEERKRIARELHDEVGQSLTAVKLGLPFIENARTPDEVKMRTENIRETINVTLDSLKELIWALRPSSLDDLGLEAAVKKHIVNHILKLGINADFQVHNLAEINLQPDVVTTVFRIVQESVTNAMKHAEAKNISIILERNCDFFTAIIEDDGKGFDINEVRRSSLKGKCFGLFGMEERADLVKGKLIIESEPGFGTTIYFKLPLEKVLDNGEN